MVKIIEALGPFCEKDIEFLEDNNKIYVEGLQNAFGSNSHNFFKKFWSANPKIVSLIK